MLNYNVYIIPNELDKQYIELLNELIVKKQSIFRCYKFLYYPLNDKSICKIQKVSNKAYVLIQENGEIVIYDMSDLITIQELMYEYNIKDEMTNAKNDSTRDFHYVMLLKKSNVRDRISK